MNDFFSYNESKKIIKDNNVSTTGAYMLFVKEHNKSSKILLPSNPNSYYSDDWVDWFSYFDKPRDRAVRKYKKGLSKRFMTYSQLKVFCRKNSISTSNLYKAFDLPESAPKNPQQTYADYGWVSWRDLLADKNVATLADVIGVCKDHNIRTESGLRDWNKKTQFLNLPSNFVIYYKTENYVSFRESITQRFVSYGAAKKIIHGFGITTRTGFDKWKSTIKSSDIPAKPDRYYNNFNWSDFLHAN